jgi:hypothetical protein
VRSGLGAFLALLGLDPGEGLGVLPVANSRGEIVGDVRAV